MRRLPYRLRRVVFRSVHAQFGGQLAPASRPAPICRRSLQQAWEDLGIVVIQGYGSTECGIVTANDQWRHLPGVVGRVRAPSVVKLDPETSEILSGSQRLGRLLARRGGHGGVARRRRLVR